jgi:signal transduction histidine kinase
MRFSQKIFLAMLILMVAASCGTTAAVYTRSLRAGVASERARAETEQYAVVLGISRAADDYALGTMLAGFVDAYASTGAQLELMQVENYGRRTVEIVSDGTEKSVVVTSGLPAPFQKYALRYRRSLSSMETAQSRLLGGLALIHIAAVVLFAGFSWLVLYGLSTPLRRLNRDMRKLAEGGRIRNTPIRGQDEFSELSLRFRAMARAIERKTAALGSENARRQQFIDNLSHELRTPVTSIHGYALLLRDAKLDLSRREEALDYLIAESERIGTLSEKLLTITSLSAGSVEMERLDCEALLKQAVQSVVALFSDSGVNIRYQTDGGTVLGDETLLLSLVINLLQNAVRASAPGSLVNVSFGGEGPVLRVEDQGRGMTKEQQDHAVEPFYRADKARSRKQGGVGLGLSICAAIADAHGANLSISSEVGKGTRVEVQFTNPIQPGGDMDTEKAVPSHQGEIPKKEGTTMNGKIRRRKASGILTAVIALVVLAGGVMFTKGVLERSSDAVWSAQASTRQDASVLVPLPAADARYEHFSMNREISDEENKIHTMLVEQFQKALVKKYGDDNGQRYETEIGEYVESMGVGPLPDERIQDGPYLSYTDSSVQLVLPERMLTEREIWQIIRFNYEVLDPAQTALFCAQGMGKEGRPYSENERARMGKLQAQYESEGLRPESPIPTAPTEDGFYHDPNIGPYHVSLTRTYELSDEQLLEIIDLNRRANQKFEEDVIAPVRSRHTDAEWIAIALGLFEEKGLPFEEKTGGYWEILFSTFNDGETPGALLTYGTKDEQWSMENCCWVSFDPLNDNRVASISMPWYKDHAVGESLLSTSITQDRWRAVLADPEWTKIAEAYARMHIYDRDAKLTVQTSTETNNDPFTRFDKDDIAPAHEAVYIQVSVVSQDGGGVVIDIDPDTKQVNGYSERDI